MISDEEIVRDRRKPGIARSNTLWPRSGAAESPFPPPAPLAELSIGQLFLATAGERGVKAFCRYRSAPDLEWDFITWRHAGLIVCEIAAKLVELGVKKGDRVAIMSSTRFEWLLADFAILTVGAVSTPIFQTLTPPEVGYVLWDSGATVVFAENQEQLNKLAEIQNKPFVVPAIEGHPGGEVTIDIKHVLLFEDGGSHTLHDRVTMLRTFIPADAGIEADEVIKKWGKKTADIRSTDLASIVYTSGTTDPPKGVMQTHGNHLSMLDMLVLSGLVGTAEGVFLYLPLAHSFARLIAYAILPAAGDIIFPTIIDRKFSKFDAKQLIKDLQQTGPRIFPSVPRIFEKLQDTLSGGGKPSRKTRLLSWARRVFAESLLDEGAGSEWNPVTGIKRAFATRIVRSVKQKLFGSNLLYCISGGAPISVETLKFFQSIDIIILEGYGLTETCPATNANTIEKYKFGTVGRLFEGVECILNPEDGEICVRGGNIAQGYWKRPKSTKESWPGEGWFLTGDIGEFDDEGFLRITDRKKDIIVTSSGKKIPPTFIEGKLKASPYISQALVYGEKRSYLVALITVNPAAVEQWAEGLGLGEKEGKEKKDAKVNELIRGEIDGLLRDLASYEQVRKFVVLDEDFSVENGLLGPSLKMRRKVVVGRYLGVIEGMYGI